MSVNLYQTGVSGLLAAQQQLATTGHNIANVNTEGYSRQRAEQSPALGLYNGDNYIGSGAYIKDIRRVYDKFAQREELSNQTNLGFANGMNTNLDQLNNIMSSSGESINSSIEEFYVSINAIADDPSNIGLRNMTLSQAGIVATNFNSIDSQFVQLEKSVNGEIEQIARKITEISKEIARINDQVIQNHSFDGNGKPNSLLDSQDLLISELATLTKVNAIEDDNGVLTVMIGNGTTLVAGASALSIEVQAGDPDPAQTQLRLINGPTRLKLDQETIGGELGAKFRYRDEHLFQARFDIDRIATSLASTINNIQEQGLDLNIQQGANFFNDINSSILMQSRAISYSANTGTLVGEVQVNNLTSLSSNAFEIEFDGTNYNMTDLNSGTSYTLVFNGTGYTPPAPDDFGFQFLLASGAASAGDKFLIRPGENSAALMKRVLANGEGIAAASAIEIIPSNDNISAGNVNIVNVTNPIAAKALMPTRVEVLETPTGSGNFQYELFDNTNTSLGTATYTPPSQTINIGGAFDIEIAGTPSGQAANAPEVFNIVDAFGIGNGTNAFVMADTKNIGTLNNGRETFNQNLAITTATVGNDARSAEIVAETADALYTQAYNRNQSVKGVNLDEEAADLLRFQQAYQASSKIVSVASTIFDTLLNAAR